MSRFWRTILFAIFAIGFLISAPLVVLYTAGYRYQFGSGRVVKAGVLSVSSTPKGATVSLNGITNTKRTPAVIDDVFPGSVTIRLEKPGYTSWQKKLPIESNQSTFVNNAILFLNEPPTQTIDQTSVVAVALQTPSRFAYLVNHNNTLEWWVNDLAFKQTRLITQQPYHSKSTYTLNWSPDGTYLLVDELSTKKTFSVLRVFDSHIISLPTTDISDTWWETGSDHTLVYQTKTGELRIMGIDADMSLPKNTRADDVQHKDGKLLVIQKTDDRSVLSYLDSSGVASIIAYLPLGSYQFSRAPSPYFLLQETKSHHLLLIDPRNQNPISFNEEVALWEWSPKEDRLLFSNGFDVNIFTPDSRETETLTRFSEAITNLTWYPIGDEVLYGRNSSILGLELDRRDTRNEVGLVDGYTIQTMWVSKDGSSLFFLGHKGAEPITIFERKLQK